MSRRLIFVCLLALLALFLSPSLRSYIWRHVDQGPVRAALSLSEVNAPPDLDPDCFDRLSALPGVSIARSSTFTQGEVCVVEGVVFVSKLAGLNFKPNRALMQCGVAESLNAWLEDAAKPAAREHLNTNITRVGHMGTYNCRTIGGNSRILSQHSFANAIDVAWFDLGNGTRTRLIEGWGKAGPQQQKFWHAIKDDSCDYFDTSLGPNYNAAHADHFHFDLGPFRACR